MDPDIKLPESAAAHISGATAAAASTRYSPAAGSAAASHVETDAGRSQAAQGHEDSPYSNLSYSAFYPEEPEQSSSQSDWPVRDDSEEALTAGEGSLSLWGREAVRPRTDAEASAPLQQHQLDAAGASPQPVLADADVASAQQQRPAYAPEASSEHSSVPRAENAGTHGWKTAAPDNSRGTKSEGEEHFVAAPNAHGQGEPSLSYPDLVGSDVRSHMKCMTICLLLLQSAQVSLHLMVPT